MADIDSRSERDAWIDDIGLAPADFTASFFTIGGLSSQDVFYGTVPSLINYALLGGP